MTGRRGERGFGLVTAIFLLVVLAAAGAAMLKLAGAERAGSSLALREARAYHAARSGIEWGARQTVTLGACPAPTTLTLMQGGLAGFTVDIACSSSGHTVGSTVTTLYRVVATARAGSFGQPDHVRRVVDATVTTTP